MRLYLPCEMSFSTAGRPLNNVFTPHDTVLLSIPTTPRMLISLACWSKSDALMLGTEGSSDCTASADSEFGRLFIYEQRATYDSRRTAGLCNTNKRRSLRDAELTTIPALRRFRVSSEVNLSSSHPHGSSCAANESVRSNERGSKTPHMHTTFGAETKGPTITTGK